MTTASPSPPEPARPLYDFSIVRELRKRAGLTIGALSERSGVSSAVISRLERNQATAELETLYRIGRAFGLSATEIIALAESRIAHKTAEDRYQSDGFRFRAVRFGSLACFLGEAPAGAHVSRPEIHQDDYETCWVLDGRIRLALPHEAYELEPGESVQFDAAQPHTYHALADSRIILVHIRKNKRF